MIILGYLLSILTGYFLVQLIIQRHYRLNTLLHFCLAILLGLGINATLTFYSIVMFNGFYQNAVLGINILFFITIWIISLKFYQQGKLDFQLYEQFHPAQVLGLLIWISLGCVLYLVASRYPFGDWDAWAIWNLKTKFMLLGGHHWQSIFHDLTWHTHPDYPLLLPSMHAWIYSLSAQKLYPIPLITANLFSILGGVLLYSSLVQFNVKRRLAFLFSCLLLAHPFYHFLTSSQYADILLACYLLASVVVMVLFIRTARPQLALITGLLMGLTTFTKNEGVVMILLLSGMMLFTLFTDRTLSKNRRWELLRAWGLGIILTGLPTLILKCFLAPGNDDIVGGFAMSNIFEAPAARYSIFFQEIVRQLFIDRKWCYIWPFLLFMYMIGFNKLFYRENKILTVFVIGYISIIAGIYLYTQMNVDLKWWLDSSLRRILLTILPVILFSGLYLHWRPEHIDKT